MEKIWLRKILGNMHLVTIWNVCWGRTVTVMENVVKHKSSRYSGRIGFNKCPEILFSEPKKGLIRTLVENICQFLSTFGHSSQHLDIPSVSTIRFTEIRKSYHTSFGAFLMHFWCTFPFFYILLILQKSTKKLCKIFWISKIAKLVKLLALET